MAFALASPSVWAQQTIASQSFDGVGLSVDQVVTANPFNSTNAPSAFNAGGPELDFSSSFTDSRGNGLTGTVTAGENGDAIGVSTGNAAPQVNGAPTNNPDGNPIGASERVFVFDNTDGGITLSFEPVDVSEFESRQIRVPYTAAATTFGTNDELVVTVGDGSTTVTVLEILSNDLELLLATWNTLVVDLDDVITTNGLDETNIILSVRGDTNSKGEELFIDEILFTGTLSCSGETDPCAVTSGVEGWRMISVPGTGLTVNDLAAFNLVRGIATDDTDPPNIYTAYGGNQAPGGNDGFVAPLATDALVPGEGIFWYFFDSADPPVVDPDALGAIQELPILIVDTVTPVPGSAGVSYPVRPNNDGFYLAGNPFTTSFSLAGIAARNGTTLATLTVSDVVTIWDPALNSGAGAYATYSRSGAGGNPQIVAPWQGFWLEITDGAGGTVTDATVEVGYGAAFQTTGGGFVGRQAVPVGLKLVLSGTANDGRALANEVSLFFHEESTDGWDTFDASSLGSFGTPYVLAGLVGDRGDETDMWKYQDARPLVDDLHTFDLAYTGFGVEDSYAFSWPSLENVPEAWSVTLRDLVTGTEVDLRAESSYAFTPAEGEPAARFEVLVGVNNTVSNEEGLPDVFAVGELYPNPSSMSATLAVRVAESQEASVTVYDVLGRQVLAGAVTLRAGAEERLDVDVSALPAGTYVVRVAGESFAETRRLTVVR
ncbi:MAG: T9SS type A sorting domain-containing protein [Bacteroidota bacterium]